MFCAPEAVPRITLTRPTVKIELHPERRHVGVAVGGVVGPVHGRDVDDAAQEQGGERRPDQLHQYVAGHTLPREVTPQGKGDTDTAGLRCAPDTLPMNKMIAMTISAGATTAAWRLITRGRPGPSCRHRRRRERGRRCRPARKKAPPLLTGVVEVRDPLDDALLVAGQWPEWKCGHTLWRGGCARRTGHRIAPLRWIGPPESVSPRVGVCTSRMSLGHVPGVILGRSVSPHRGWVAGARRGERPWPADRTSWTITRGEPGIRRRGARHASRFQRPDRFRERRSGLPRQHRAHGHQLRRRVPMDMDGWAFEEACPERRTRPLAQGARHPPRPLRGDRGHLPGSRVRPLEHDPRRGRSGVIVIDPLVSAETAAAAPRLVPGAPRRASGRRR